MGQTHFNINELLNMDSVFLRDITIAFIKNWQQKIWWLNRFTNETKLVTVPFYYSMTGDERFLLDTFVDDIVDKRVELNTDIIPRGHVTLTNVTPNFSEMANPHVWLKSHVEGAEETFRIMSKVIAMPVTINYDCEIVVDSEIDTFKCVEKVLNTLHIYKFFDIEHKGIYVEAVLKLPEGTEIKMPREHNMSSDTSKSVKYSVEVKTHYPIVDLNWDGNLDTLKKFLGVIPGDPLEDSTFHRNVEANSFGTAFFLANKRVQWNNYITGLNLNSEETGGPI